MPTVRYHSQSPGLQPLPGATTSGINPTPDKDEPDARSKVAWLRERIAEEVRRVQDITKAKVTNEELDAIARRILGQQGLDRRWFTNSTQNIMDAAIEDVPAVDKAQIIASFKRRGVTNPTDQQILLMWLDKQLEGAK